MRVRVNPKNVDWSDAPATPDEQRQGALSSYLYSLPERAVRSLSAVSAGLLREVSEAALPAPLRRSRLYQNMVEATLRFLIEQVGEVEGSYPDEGRLSKSFAMRRTVGNGIELAGILAFRASPVWVMAALADVSGTSRVLLREISQELKQEGLIEPDFELDSVDRLLDGVERTSARVAANVNAPPLDVASLRTELAEIRREAAMIPPTKLPSPDLLLSEWRALRDEARVQQRGVWDLSAAMALDALANLPESARRLSLGARVAARRTGGVLGAPILDHYRQTLGEIRETGFLTFWSRQFRPYLRAAAHQFSREKSTWTERRLSPWPQRQQGGVSDE